MKLKHRELLDGVERAIIEGNGALVLERIETTCQVAELRD